MILEGVHVYPTLLARLQTPGDAIVASFSLGVLKAKRLRKRITGRGRSNPDRRAERYLSHFDEIWHLQSFVLGEAERMGVPVIENNDREKTVREALRIVLAQLGEHFHSSPEEVFNRAA